MGWPRLALPAAVTATFIVAACGSGSRSTATQTALADQAISVASFNFPESVLLAEIYSQALEAGGFTVKRTFDLGPRELVDPALMRGLVELVPEYAGTALQFVSVGRDAPGSDVAATQAALARALEGTPVTALGSAPAQDANTFVERRQTAQRTGTTKLSDLSGNARSLTFGGPPECPQRPLCLAGLKDRYGIDFGQVIPLDTGGPLTMQALRSGGVDVALLFTTDPATVDPELVELADDRGLQPTENVTPLVRRDVITKFGPKVRERVDAVSTRLTTAVLRGLNAELASKPGSVRAVAARWLGSLKAAA
jgi:osmoprotectant transport system substrate-binding protein